MNKPLLVLCTLFVSANLAFSMTASPVIGILTEPSKYGDNGFPSTNWSFIAGSYVDFIQGAGGRVIPIQWDLPFDEIDVLLSKINGVIFPGGAVGLNSKSNTKLPSQFGATGQHIYHKILEYNRNGTYFPLWGTCLGYELLTMCVADDFSLLVSIKNSDDVARPIILNSNAAKSRLYGSFQPSLLQSIQTENLTFFHHTKTPNQTAFVTNPNLASNVTVLATAVDSISGTYICTWEGTKWPLYATQFHPEKNAYEWYSVYSIPHTLDAILAEQAYATFFVNDARNNPNKFDSESDYMNVSIYNYGAYHFGTDPQFQQVYFIPNYAPEGTSDEYYSSDDFSFDGEMLFDIEKIDL